MDTKPRNLTKKQRVFIDEYLKSGNATEAARIAGYSPKTAYIIGHENLNKPNIHQVIETRLSESHMSATAVLDGISDIARGDMGDFMDITSMGFVLNLVRAKEKGLTKLIKKIKQKTTIFIAKKESDEDREVHEIEIELYSALEAKTTLGKYHKLFAERVEHTGAEGGRIDVHLVKDD